MELRPKPPKLHYLTVQDILWINLQVTKTTHTFNYAKLEEATYYQYAYGDSDDLFAQASRFTRGFQKLAPLAEGNEATAFVAVNTFLLLNGAELTVDDRQAAEWFRSGASTSAVSRLEDEHSLSDKVRDVVVHVMQRFPDSISALAGRPIIPSSNSASKVLPRRRSISVPTS